VVLRRRHEGNRTPGVAEEPNCHRAQHRSSKSSDSAWADHDEVGISEGFSDRLVRTVESELTCRAPIRIGPVPASDVFVGRARV